MLRCVKLSLISIYAFMIVFHVSVGQQSAIAQEKAQTDQPASESSVDNQEAEPLEPEPETEIRTEAVEEIEPSELIDAEKRLGDFAEEVRPAFPMRFGYDFFAGARNRITMLERIYALPARTATQVTATPPVTDTSELPQTPVRDAISGFVGPVDMMGANVAATVPSKYVLAPGDRLTVQFWSDALDLQTLQLVVDEKGEVIVPRIGNMVVRGMTLEQFQEAVKQHLERVAYKNLTLVATLGPLRSIQVFITGDGAFRPGSYNMSAVATLINALYLCGGPNGNGSLRDIKLLRNGETKSVDFYRFLMEGDSSQDYGLNAGDTIVIPQVGRTVTISGEVKRPAIYELKDGENLQDLLSLAGGIRPSGFLQRVQIDSVKPGRERILLDIDMSDGETSAPIFDGDTVTIFSIPSERMNTITVEGKVRMPGIYQLKEGMTLSDLIRASQGILGEAYTERADLLRLNDDRRTTKLIPIDLSKAFAGDIVHNMLLKQWDRLVVYSKWDVKWSAERVVTIRGAVQNPGSYEKPDGMTIEDLLMRAGGALPDAYLDRAWLMRLDERGEMTRGIPVDLRGRENDLELDDGDFLMIYTYQEARWEPRREVTIEGAVQNPDTYTRVSGMTVSDLIHRAGGFLPEAYLNRALLFRLDNRQRITEGFSINLRLAIRDDPKNNLELKDGDKLKIYTYQEAEWEAERKVTIVGAVHRPGDVLITDEPGVVPDVRRPGEVEQPIETQLREAGVLRGTAQGEPAAAGPSVIALPEQVQPEVEAVSPFLIPAAGEEEGEEEESAPKMGSVFERYDGMKISDLIQQAGGLLPNAYLERADLRRFRSDYETYITISVDLSKVLAGDKEADILLQDEDMLTVYTIREAQYKPENTVIMYGAVQRPDVYTRSIGMKLSDLLFVSGGLVPGALKDAEITQIDEYGQTVTRTVDVVALLGGDRSRDIILQDGDVVSIRKDNEFLDVLRTVTIEGEVKYPGSYALKRNERLSDLIERAGGLTDRAFPEASVITRKEEYLTLDEQRKSMNQVKELLETLSEQEYQREVAKTALIEARRRGYREGELIPASAFPGISSAAASALERIPQETERAISDIETITGTQYTLVTPARIVESFFPPGRVIVNLNEAISNPGRKDDIMLEDGDKIVIPTRVDTVSVTGAVIQPSSLVYVKTIKPKKVKDYIEMVGGYSRDADIEAVYVVKANGMVIRGNKADIDAGDIIVVPTKIMTQKITDRWGQVISAAKFTVTTLALVLTVKLVLDAVKS